VQQDRKDSILSRRISWTLTSFKQDENLPEDDKFARRTDWSPQGNTVSIQWLIDETDQAI